MEFPSDLRRPPTREEHFVLEDLPARERMLFGTLAYVAFPIPLYYARWDPFVRFHTRQGVGVAIGWVLSRFFARFAFVNEIPEVSFAGYALVTVAACVGIRHALGLEWKGLPMLGGLVDRLPLPKKLAESHPR